MGETIDRWVCPACEGRFDLLSQLIRHVEAEHPDDEKVLARVRGLAEEE